MGTRRLACGWLLVAALAAGPTRAPPPAARARTPVPDADVPGVFRILGPHSYGGPDARFGAPRSGHTHQGQDVMAAEGTPLVAPRPGTVIHRAYQAHGAGYYLVIHGDAPDHGPGYGVM